VSGAGFSPPPRPRWLERLNAHAATAGGAQRLVSLDPAELLETAAASTGLDDFGDAPEFGGGAWRDSWDCLLRALEQESQLTLAGRLLARSELLRSLRNRLQLTALWKRQPELLEAGVAPPVFIVGSARSGTSILHELLAQDPASRAPAMWEMLHPVESLSGEALRETGDRVMTFWHDLQPEYEAMHANSGELPNECIFITMNEFLSDHWGGVHDVPSYALHVLRADHRGAYRFHRRFLRTLEQRRRGERWLLKAPSHLGTLDALFDVYPQARVIQIHRDPLKTLPSTISLLGTLKWMRCERVDLSAAARALPAGTERMFRREIEQRASGALPDERFVDLRFQDLMRDPLAAIEALYERLGWELSPESRRAMAAYAAAKPRGARGVHRYDARALGLDPDELRRRFRFYCERFDVPEET
jgi:hypothetical protein